MKDCFILFNKHCGYHEKHQAWVISRCPSQVNLTGGSWFEPQHFKQLQDLIQYLTVTFGKGAA